MFIKYKVTLLTQQLQSNFNRKEGKNGNVNVGFFSSFLLLPCKIVQSEKHKTISYFFFHILNVKLVQIRVVSSISGHSIYQDNKLLELIVCFCLTGVDWFIEMHPSIQEGIRCTKAI